MADISQVKLPNNTTYDLSVKAEKIKSGYLSNRIYLTTQPEDGGSAVLPFLYNDLAFLTTKGGSIDAYLTTDTTYTVDALSNRTEYAIRSPESMFDGSPSYATNIVRGGTDTATDIRVIDLTLHKMIQYSNVFYIDFGAFKWRASNIQVLVKNSATETNYVKKIDITNNRIGQCFASVSHTSTNSSGSTVQGFNRMRIVLSGFTSGNTTGNTRIAQIGLINCGSAGVRETYMSRGIDDPIYRSITPNTDNTYDLGSASKKWANGYFTNINGVAVGSSPKFTDTTYTAGTGLALASNKFYNKGAEFIYGTQTATTNAWTGVTTDPELYDGKEIIYFLPFAGNSSGSTLNLTLAGGTTTGAKNVYFNSTTRHTTHYGQYQMIRMVYHNSLTINGTAYSGWWIDYARDLNDTAKYHKTAGVIYKVATVLYRYQICLEVDDTSLVPINTVSNSTATNKTLTTSSFRPFGRILYYGNINTVNANTNIPDDGLQFNTSIDLRYSFNTGSTLTAQKAVYMVCTPQSDGRAKLYSSPITQTLPSSDDGKYYIYLGNAISTTKLSLSHHHPVYMYKSGAVREISQYAEHAGSTSYDSATETLTINL